MNAYLRQEANVSVEPVDRLVRRPMPLEDYLALPEGVRAEWVDGMVVMAPHASTGHNEVLFRLALLLKGALPATGVHVEPNVVVAEGRRYRIPDLVVVPAFKDVDWVRETPVLIAEILSPSTRSEDMLRKSRDYLEAGVGQYWIVDREARTILVQSNAVDRWEDLLVLHDAARAGEVQVGEYGAVALDLPALLDL